MTFVLPPLSASFPIVDSDGRPSTQFQRFFQTMVDSIVSNDNSQTETINRIRRLASHTAPTTIAHATDNGTSATIVVDAHTRVYGDASTLAVAGSSQSGLLSNTYYAIYYDDPTLSNATPTYHFTTNKMQAQTASAEGRHFVGIVKTPAAGSGLTYDGGGVYAIGSNIGGELD